MPRLLDDSYGPIRILYARQLNGDAIAAQPLYGGLGHAVSVYPVTHLLQGLFDDLIVQIVGVFLIEGYHQHGRGPAPGLGLGQDLAVVLVDQGYGLGQPLGIEPLNLYGVIGNLLPDGIKFYALIF